MRIRTLIYLIISFIANHNMVAQNKKVTLDINNLPKLNDYVELNNEYKLYYMKSTEKLKAGKISQQIEKDSLIVVKLCNNIALKIKPKELLIEYKKSIYRFKIKKDFSFYYLGYYKSGKDHRYCFRIQDDKIKIDIGFAINKTIKFYDFDFIEGQVKPVKIGDIYH